MIEYPTELGLVARDRHEMAVEVGQPHQDDAADSRLRFSAACPV
jgi:hypothetical protein